MHVTRRAREAPPHHLEPCADRQDHGPGGDPSRQRAVVDQRPGGAHLRTVLAATEAVNVRLGHGRVRSRLQQLDVKTAPLGPPGQDQAVTPIPVGAQQVGKDNRHAERAIHAGIPSRSWKAV